MNYTTTQHLNLSPELPPNTQKGYAVNEMRKNTCIGNQYYIQCTFIACLW